MDREDRLTSRNVGRRDEHLSVEATGAKKRRVEILEPVGGGHDDDLVTGVEAVELDEQLVQSLVVLPMDGAARTRAVPTASSSSMKTIAGAFLRASSKSLRILAAPSPANISTNEEALCE